MSEPLGVLHRAAKWAEKLHRGQERDGPAPLPYVTHPMDVACKLRYLGGVEDPVDLCAALLHDVTEECGVGLAKVGKKFGEEVASLVRELTRTEPDEERRAGLSPEELWELRSSLLLDDIRRMSPRAQRIKLADRLSNLECALATRSGEKRERYVRQSYLILEAIPRETCPPLWDAVRRLLDQERTQNGGAPAESAGGAAP
ncbi:MAG: HD domain-containing protein [Fimbriimonadales bacterium]|nr:HD domain-containing protein [Fimbriimonadales bacterium]